MKMQKCLTGALALLVASVALAEDLPIALPDPLLQLGAKKYAPPEVVKRGLCVYYQSSGSVQDKPSPTTWVVYMVDYVDKERTVGMVYRLNHSLMNVDIRPFIFPGSAGEFFYNREFLRDSALKPETGVTITEHTFTYEHERGKVAVIINDVGLITGFHSVYLSANGRTAAVLEYKGHEYIQRPAVIPQDFPAQALLPHQFTQATGGPMGMVPMAKIGVELAAKDPAVLTFKMTYQGFAGGIPAPASTSTVVGLTGWGPFYIHPGYLQTAQPGTVTAQFPKLQFKSVVSAAEMGQVKIDTYLGDQVVAVEIYDQTTGLLRMHTKHIAGGATLQTTLVQ